MMYLSDSRPDTSEAMMTFIVLYCWKRYYCAIIIPFLHLVILINTMMRTDDDMTHSDDDIIDNWWWNTILTIIIDKYYIIDDCTIIDTIDNITWRKTTTM